MSETPFALILSLPLILLGSACTPHLYSAPSRVAPLETARPVAPGETSLQVAGGRHSETWGIDASNLALRAGRGLTDGLEANLTANMTHIIGEGAVAPHPNIYTARAGLRYTPPWVENYVAFTGGLGGGGSEAGGLLTADIGLNLAYENDILVPFAVTSLWVSQPVSRRDVDLSGLDEGPGSDLQVAETTWGTSISIGVMIPVSFGSRSGPRGGIYLALAITTLRDAQQSSVVLGIAPGLEIAF